eukprot:TRINITY_DN1776_c1_g1_i1.p1 TRINITY_DN1776_c1_g1~~TRINITY_DN1776_c1_g1_i1.p1  ORF type:complete len:414 (+),score=17.46 TRINITY_DN1776_c1_g1_i1:62-1303(+)
MADLDSLVKKYHLPRQTSAILRDCGLPTVEAMKCAEWSELQSDIVSLAAEHGFVWRAGHTALCRRMFEDVRGVLVSQEVELKSFAESELFSTTAEEAVSKRSLPETSETLVPVDITAGDAGAQQDAAVYPVVVTPRTPSALPIERMATPTVASSGAATSPSHSSAGSTDTAATPNSATPSQKTQPLAEARINEVIYDLAYDPILQAISKLQAAPKKYVPLTNAEYPRELGDDVTFIVSFFWGLVFPLALPVFLVLRCRADTSYARLYGVALGIVFILTPTLLAIPLYVYLVLRWEKIYENHPDAKSPGRFTRPLGNIVGWIGLTLVTGLTPWCCCFCLVSVCRGRWFCCGPECACTTRRSYALFYAFGFIFACVCCLVVGWGLLLMIPLYRHWKRIGRFYPAHNATAGSVNPV